MLREADQNPLPEILASAYERLVEESESLHTFHTANRQFIGVANDQRGVLNLTVVRRVISTILWSNDSLPQIVQIVGDSGTAFNDEAVVRAQAVLINNIANDSIIEYGFTCVKHDANWLVQDYLSSNPEAAIHTIANIVGRSIDSLRSAGWTGSELVTTFVMLYSKDGTLTDFGEDTWVSDGTMLEGTGDRMLCFEGGAQAFHQCVSVLLRGIEVMPMTDLRPANEAERFSAAQLLLLIKDGGDGIVIEQRLDEYLTTHPPEGGEQVVAIRQDLYQLKHCGRDVPRLIMNCVSAQ